MSLQYLHLDVLIEILSYIEVRDVLSMQRTCKDIERVTQLHAVWKSVLENQIIPSGRSVPLPSNAPLSAHSARDLKQATIYSMRLGRNWTSAEPRAFARTQFYIGAPATYVQITFFIPGHGGKYLLAVSGGNRVSIWHLGLDLKRTWKILGWNIQGAIVDAVPNSDSGARATIALSYVANQHRYTTLYNLTFSGDGSGHATATCEQIFEGELPGRLKILRGNLVGLYKRSHLQGYLFNYESQVMIELKGAEPTTQHHGTCLAMEVLSDCVIMIQPQSVNIFALPEVARDTEPPPAETKVFQAQHISTAFRPGNSDWHSGVIIPYCAPYPAQRATHPSHPISLIREKSATILSHFLVYCPPDPQPFVVRARRSNNDPRPRDFTELPLCIAQIRNGVRQHFFPDVMASPISGRGIWLEGSPTEERSTEQLVLFNASEEVIDDDLRLSDIGKPDNKKRTHKGATIAAKEMPHAVKDCTYCSFDDGTGRVVVATRHGQVRILQFGIA
ncbi:uncharacterized protein EI90DRAFT_3154615 [Cantharellus anzutake]|uniref:uncharacterized protein n=1 Tax=Cantharellus anzutake TaxID=1750568 RepID=UPI00190679E5|nr:uncharacterized protein EI90DRAFT_3154615 [Cantharellus anzutake]KAF8331370.1 hypothetical protein EI90DRAFT_3154615 [Cantharellus anzutake]